MNPAEENKNVYTEKHSDNLFKRTEVLAGEYLAGGQWEGAWEGLVCLRRVYPGVAKLAAYHLSAGSSLESLLCWSEKLGRSFIFIFC